MQTAISKSRRLLLKSLTTVAIMPLFSKCTLAEETLTVASQVWGGYELMFLARREGWLLPESVKFIETLSATESREALANGKVDCAALTLDEVLRVREQGIPLVCVLVFDVSAGADIVLSKTDFNSLADLAGKRIGYEPSALGALILHKLLEAAKLEKSAITPIAVEFDKHADAWHQNKVDVLITYDPVANQLLNEGASKIFDSRKMPDTIFDVLAVNPQTILNRSQHLQSLITAHFRARHYFYHNAQDAAYKMALRMKLPASEVLNSFRGLNLPNEEANQKYLTEQQSSLLMTAKILSEIMVENGMLKQMDNLQGLVNADYLPIS